MNEETMLYLSITLLGLLIMYLYFHWKCIRHYAKIRLKEPNPNNVICLVVKDMKE